MSVRIVAVRARVLRGLAVAGAWDQVMSMELMHHA
jgi:hypothetical protein